MLLHLVDVRILNFKFLLLFPFWAFWVYFQQVLSSEIMEDLNLSCNYLQTAHEYDLVSYILLYIQNKRLIIIDRDALW